MKGLHACGSINNAAKLANYHKSLCRKLATASHTVLHSEKDISCNGESRQLMRQQILGILQ
jgi:hypothetical protein